MKNTKIEWADHTFNPWIGCSKVSPGCANCYAERDQDIRRGRARWGENGTRSRTSEAYWKQPHTWNRKAARDGTKPRVFCASLADVFEFPQNQKLYSTLHGWRMDLFNLIHQTPNLIWMLLTKRPAYMRGYMSEYFPKPLPNIWLGVSVENQAAADFRIPFLIGTPSVCRFLSCEPLLGAVDLTKNDNGAGENFNALSAEITTHRGHTFRASDADPIDWVIVGGESGPSARPMSPSWARSIRDQCHQAGVAFFFKQWGGWCNLRAAGLLDANGNGTFADCVSHLFSARPYKDTEAPVLHRVGKKAAGRALDGKTYTEVPQPERSE